MTDDQRDWQFLLDIFYELGRLDNPLYSVFASQDSVLASQVFASQEDRQKAIQQARQEARKNVLTRALRSGKVPLEGRREAAFGELERVERIEGKIDAETEINIFLNEITLCKGYGAEGLPPEARLEPALFKRVQADKASVEQWLHENVLPAAGDEDRDDVEAGGKAEESLSPDAIPVPDKKAEEFPSPRPKKRNKQTKEDAIATWLLEHHPNREPMSVAELERVIKREAPHIGGFSRRTLEAALAEAYS
jgi:hypothetical protein